MGEGGLALLCTWLPMHSLSGARVGTTVSDLQAAGLGPPFQTFPEPKGIYRRKKSRQWGQGPDLSSVTQLAFLQPRLKSQLDPRP